jgi:hypothetical protein
MPTCLHAYVHTCISAFTLSLAGLLLLSNGLLFSSVMGDEQEIVEKKRILLEKGESTKGHTFLHSQDVRDLHEQSTTKSFYDARRHLT